MQFNNAIQTPGLDQCAGEADDKTSETSLRRVSIFPNDNACDQLFVALLTELNEQWMVKRSI